ncbi:NB-ARC domain-containing protein [Streptomyces noursei]|uniref:NB-ARC domain-containing protein n=1 Tax=Streptomyces noursei TaxID=1971 RepID=UPI0038183C8E
MAVGHADQVSYYAASRAPASWPLRVGTIPGAARCLQHRPALDRCLGPVAPTGVGGRTDAGTRVHSGVLVGTAGVGKTQHAAHLARAVWGARRVDLLVWVTAASREAIVAVYAQAMAEITGSETATPDQAAQAFLAWLKPETAGPRRRWLIVLDDVADPDDLRGLWPPDHPDGQTLITTRRRDIAQPGLNRRVVPVEGFTQDAATAYLTEILAAYGRDDRPEAIQALARELGLLPLALSQAAAYLVGAGLDCAAYVSLLRQHGGTPLAELVPGPGALPDSQDVAVHQAWLPSLERADRLPPVGLARPLLELAALLPPEGAPQSAFTGPVAAGYLREHRTAPSTDGNRPLHANDVTDALRGLDRLGVIDYAPTDPYHAVRVHPVLQRVTREAIPAHRAEQLASTVASALMDAADAHADDPGFAPVLLAAADTLRRQAEPALWPRQLSPRRDAFSAMMDAFFGDGPPPGAHPLLFRVGELLGTTGQAAAARDYFERLAGDAQRRQGLESAVARAVHERIAHWRGEAGDAPGAAVAYAALLDEEVRAFGPHHESTFTTRAALGHWRGKAGDAAGAAAAYAELLPLQQRTFGPTYWGVMETRTSLARWQGESGDPAGAARAYGALLNDLLQALGGPMLPAETLLGRMTTRPNVLDVFHAHHGHAYWRGRSGDPAGAASSFTYLLDEQLRVLGPDHPHTATTRAELARWTERARNGR